MKDDTDDAKKKLIQSQKDKMLENLRNKMQ